jgi:hypothetical protein
MGLGVETQRKKSFYRSTVLKTGFLTVSRGSPRPSNHRQAILIFGWLISPACAISMFYKLQCWIDSTFRHDQRRCLPVS